MTELLYFSIIAVIVGLILFIPVRWYEQGRFICADCPKEFDNRLKGELHRLLSLFRLHKVVKERRSGEDRRSCPRYQVSEEVEISQPWDAPEMGRESRREE